MGTVVCSKEVTAHELDIEQYGMNFVTLLATGEFLTAVDAVTCDVDEDDGGPTISDEIIDTLPDYLVATVVRFWLTGGTAGNTYRITVSVTTSTGRELSRVGIFEVEN